MAYSKQLKNSIISRMLPPNNESLGQIQQDTGIPEGTLKKWRMEIVRKSGYQCEHCNVGIRTDLSKGISGL